MDKRFWIILAVIAVVLGGVFFATNRNKPSTDSSKGTLTSHYEGKNSAGITLTEYGDFECPACGQYYNPMKQVAAKYNDQIRFQFRNFPLYQIHPNAISGARAAEAADQQGKYWEMHDKLYDENYSQQVASAQGSTYATWTTAKDPNGDFNDYAKAIGLNVTKFQADFKSAKVNNLVQADLAEGNKLGVNSTPTFFINGKKISNPDATLEAFSKVIDAEIAKQTKK